MKKTIGFCAFDEVTVIIKGRDEKGRPVRIKHQHRIEAHSLHMASMRPHKVKKTKIIPSEYVFHTLNFITSSKA